MGNGDVRAFVAIADAKIRCVLLGCLNVFSVGDDFAIADPKIRVTWIFAWAMSISGFLAFAKAIVRTQLRKKNVEYVPDVEGSLVGGMIFNFGVATWTRNCCFTLNPKP